MKARQQNSARRRGDCPPLGLVGASQISHHVTHLRTRPHPWALTLRSDNVVKLLPVREGLNMFREVKGLAAQIFLVVLVHVDQSTCEPRGVGLCRSNGRRTRKPFTAQDTHKIHRASRRICPDRWPRASMLGIHRYPAWMLWGTGRGRSIYLPSASRRYLEQ